MDGQIVTFQLKMNREFCATVLAFIPSFQGKAVKAKR